MSGQDGAGRLGLSPEVLTCAEVLYEYQRLRQLLVPSDVILVLCSNDLRVADYAAALAQRELAPHVVFSGGMAHHGDLLETGWSEPEALVFARRSVERGLSPERVLLETRASNTGENLVLSRHLLKERGLEPQSALLVQKPFSERRTYATARKLWPDIRVVVTSPPASLLEWLREGDLRPDAIIHVMVGDLERIARYPERGFQIPQLIPDAVWRAFERLVALGFDRHLL